MSNRIRNKNSTLFIPKDQLDTVYRTLRETPLPKDGWATVEGVARALNIKELFNAWGHNPRFDSQGNIISLYLYWEWPVEDTMSALYGVLGPFVRAESVQEFTDDYDNHWRWLYNGTTAVRQTGTVVYENDTPDDDTITTK